MIAIDDKLISEDVFSSYFACELETCKGACCWEGDFGAPLKEEELNKLDDVIPHLNQYLPEASYLYIKENGAYLYNDELGVYVTNLMPDGACVFMTRDKEGIAHCGIEQAFKDGRHEFQKPISCHLYPIRILERPEQGFTAINYDRWKICNPACKNGKKNKIPLYQFLKDALVRRFGNNFYQEMESVAFELEKTKQL